MVRLHKTVARSTTGTLDYLLYDKLHFGLFLLFDHLSYEIFNFNILWGCRVKTGGRPGRRYSSKGFFLRENRR